MKHSLHSLRCFAKTFILSLCCLFTSHLFSQTIDSSFAVNGKLILPDFTFLSHSGSMLFQNNKILVSLWTDDADDYYPASDIFRLTANGKIDSTFGNYNYGYLNISSLKGAYFTVQDDNRILVTGKLQERDGPDPLGTVAVYRFLPSGKRDLNFGTNGRFHTLLSLYSSFNTVAQKDNGKILAAGSLTTRNDSTGITIIQLNRNGSLDSNFGTKGFIYKTSPYEGTCYALKVLPHGKILAGFMYAMDTKSVGASIIRYKKTGAIDSSFGMNGVVLVGNHTKVLPNAIPISISLVGDGKIIVFTGDSTAQGVLCRYTKVGQPDLPFGINGKVTAISHDHKYTFFVTTDSANRILINQTTGKGIMSVARFKINGRPDNSFGVNGVIPMDTTADAILVAPDNKLIVYGYSSFAPLPDVTRFKFDSLSGLQNAAISAITKQNINENIVAYPNPATNVLHIAGVTSNTNYLLNIVDAKENIIVTKHATGNCDLNVQRLSPGIYYVNIFVGSKVFTKKFIKE
jgi:uncharacterized delta-60 repeat protein